MQSSFMTKGAPAACDILHQVFKLQEKKAISVYFLKCGLDDQDPEDWDDADVLLGEGLTLKALSCLMWTALLQMRRPERERREMKWRRRRTGGGYTFASALSHSDGG